MPSSRRSLRNKKHNRSRKHVNRLTLKYKNNKSHKIAYIKTKLRSFNSSRLNQFVALLGSQSVYWDLSGHYKNPNALIQDLDSHLKSANSVDLETLIEAVDNA